MILIAYSPVHAQSLQQNLGKPEYSYYFVLKQFLPVLERIGKVILVNDANDVDVVCDNAVSSGEDCIFICCAPPHISVTARACPTTTLFAWEFANVTTESWNDDPRTDWRNVFSAHGQTICLSSYTADAVKIAMGDDFPVRAIPVPVYDQFAAAQRQHDPVTQKTSIDIRGNVFDSRYCRFDGDNYDYQAPPHYFVTQQWDRSTTLLDFTHRAEASGLLIGFYDSEPWGTWSRAKAPSIALPFTLQGKCRLTLNAAGFSSNAGSQVQLEIGSQIFPFTLSASFDDHVIDIDVAEPATRIRFGGLDNTPVEGINDPRSMAIAVCWLRLENADSQQYRIEEMEKPEINVELAGVIYTTVLNPADGRKNWEEIVTAFCYAFRDNANATLVAKFTHHSVTAFLGPLHSLLQRIGSMQCRVVVLHGFLDDEQYRSLIDITTYYVNASLCEGLCLPLMEFMSACKPAIAPQHTAMRDYVTPASTFIVDASAQPAIWPQDPRVRLRSYFYRIDWQSLAQAFANSYSLVQANLAHYHEMGRQAAEDVRRCSCNNIVEASLREFLQQALTRRDEKQSVTAKGGDA